MLGTDWVRVKMGQRKGRGKSLRLAQAFSFEQIRKDDNSWVGWD